MSRVKRLEVRLSGRRGRRLASRAFTLVELLVVIAIIGVLVALLLPAIQAAREAARRSQCTNHVKQMMVSMHNHEAAKKAFPSGGIAPWPNLALYLTGPNGSPFGPEKQGLSWAFQILPYLEGQAVYSIKTQAEVERQSIPMYHCPTRRPPTRHPTSNTTLMDYAAAVPFMARGEGTLSLGQYTNAMGPATQTEWGTKACQLQTMWCGMSNSGPRFEDEMTAAKTASGLGTNYVPPMGVIVRSGWSAVKKASTGFYTQISFHQITDGSSNTMVLSEKSVAPSLYDVGEWHDDRGWTDGWDPDTLRVPVCTPIADADLNHTAQGYKFGSAHPSGMNAGFADASARTITYDIDIEVFNNLCHRADGQAASSESL